MCSSARPAGVCIPPSTQRSLACVPHHCRPDVMAYGNISSSVRTTQDTGSEAWAEALGGTASGGERVGLRAWQPCKQGISVSASLHQRQTELSGAGGTDRLAGRLSGSSSCFFWMQMVTMTCTRLMRLKGRSPVSMLHISTPACSFPVEHAW